MDRDRGRRAVFRGDDGAAVSPRPARSAPPLQLPPVSPGVAARQTSPSARRAVRRPDQPGTSAPIAAPCPPGHIPRSAPAQTAGQQPRHPDQPSPHAGAPWHNSTGRESSLRGCRRHDRDSRRSVVAIRRSQLDGPGTTPPSQAWLIPPPGLPEQGRFKPCSGEKAQWPRRELNPHGDCREVPRSQIPAAQNPAHFPPISSTWSRTGTR